MRVLPLLALLALVKGIAGKPKRFPADWKNLPRDLVEIGAAAFGSKEELWKEVSKTAEPQRFDLRRSDTKTNIGVVWMVQRAGDNSVVRLLKEFRLDAYGLSWATQPGALVDIGANIGDQSIMAALFHPTKQIIGIEASPVTYFFFRWNLHLNQIPLLTPSDIHREGQHEGGRPTSGLFSFLKRGAGAKASAKAGVLAINAAVVGLNRTATREGDPSRLPDVEIRTAKGGGHSQDTSLKWVHTDADDGKVWLVSKVPAVHLPTFLRGVPLRLLKIDCEGCEYDAFHSDPRFFADEARVPILAGEFHMALGLGAFAASASERKLYYQKHQKVAPQASREAVLSLRDVLKERGCPISTKARC